MKKLNSSLLARSEVELLLKSERVWMRDKAKNMLLCLARELRPYLGNDGANVIVRRAKDFANEVTSEWEKHPK